MFVKNLLKPKIILLMLLYTIVVFSVWPFLIWCTAVLVIALCELIIYIKDLIILNFFSSKSFRNAPVVYTNHLPQKDTTINLNNIDWSKFSMSNYPKVNYRKIYWEHKPFVYRGNECRYPYADVMIILYIIFFFVFSYIEWIIGNYSLMRALILTAVLFVVFFIYIIYAGKKFYENDCKAEFMMDKQ